MGKLSPPILATTIPAFCSTNWGIVITIPFSMNRTVSPAQIKGISVKIKTVQSGSVLGTYIIDDVTVMLNREEIVVTISDETDIQKYVIGNFYKVQIAYIDTENEVGYYSAVALGKYTTSPKVTINSLQENQLNSHIYTYIGVYESEDITERVYLYQFDLYNNDNVLIDSSGWLLHNSDEDDRDKPKESRDQYTFSQELTIGESHRITYSVKTINNLIVSSYPYRIAQKQSIAPEIQAELLTSLNYDNGYVKINLKSLSNETLASGSFILSRACESTDYTIWEEIYRFKLTAQIPTMQLFKDFIVEQGKKYKYSIQQYSEKLISNRIMSSAIYVDFEDAFLFDGKKQLKIRYDPKISSFKKTLMETKVDTIGGKHPFIFRNGQVCYSEFSISGLISYQMDEENLFLSEKDYGLTEKTTNLTGENIAAERTFKMKVLEWLTNGEPKVFRSPAEGNFIVRLMNSSLSPNDTVSRMLHTFSCTAYEIADYNYSTLGSMGFITIDTDMTQTLQWETKTLLGQPIGNNLLTYPIATLRINDMDPGEVVKITFENNEFEEIKIGVTGSYYIDTKINITGFELKQPPRNGRGSITYAYKYSQAPMFDTIDEVNTFEIPAQQFIGETNILNNILYVNKNNEWIKNSKIELIEIYCIHIEKRPLQTISDSSKATDPFLMYYISNESRYYDCFNKKYYTSYDPTIIIDGESISVNEKEEIEFNRLGKLEQLECGNGCLVTITYQVNNISYNIEKESENITDENHYLYNLKLKFDELNQAYFALNNFLSESYIVDEEDKEAIEQYNHDNDQARANIDIAYTNYIIALSEAQQEQQRRKDESAL